MRKKSKKKDDFVDDGRTISNMNVEGMPWYRPPQSSDPSPNSEKIELTKEERRSYMWGVLKAALLIALVFAGVFFIFILFLDKIVFKN